MIVLWRSKIISHRLQTTQMGGGPTPPRMKINRIRDTTTILTSKRFSESTVYLMRLLYGCDI
jgi:hypothetical protein